MTLFVTEERATLHLRDDFCSLSLSLSVHSEIMTMYFTQEGHRRTAVILNG